MSKENLVPAQNQLAQVAVRKYDWPAIQKTDGFSDHHSSAFIFQGLLLFKCYIWVVLINASQDVKEVWPGTF